MLTYRMLNRPDDAPLKTISEPSAGNHHVLKKIPPFEIYPEPKPAQIPDHAAPESRVFDPRPMVAIVIDDIGYDSKMAARFMNLGVALSFSLLPRSPFQQEIAESLAENGLEVMLHLPLEPHHTPDVNLGMDVLLTSSTPDELIDLVIADLDAVPHITGVNNHMGSKMTENMDLMRAIFSVLKMRGLFFLDSRTTHKSICKTAAGHVGIRFAERDVFLDHILKRDFIRAQLSALIARATAQGSAVEIAHPHEMTFQVLKAMLPELTQKADLVPVSAIVATASPPPATGSNGG